MTLRFPIFRSVVALGLFASLAACASHPPPSINGRWRPVNHYSDQPQAIPLRPAHVYYVTPVDHTLKGLLERWASESHMTLDYRHESDFTIYRPVAELHGDDLRTTLAQLSSLYAAQGVSVGLEGDRIVVSRIAPPAAPVTPQS